MFTFVFIAKSQMSMVFLNRKWVGHNQQFIYVDFANFGAWHFVSKHRYVYLWHSASIMYNLTTKQTIKETFEEHVLAFGYDTPSSNEIELFLCFFFFQAKINWVNTRVVWILEISYIWMQSRTYVIFTCDRLWKPSLQNVNEILTAFVLLNESTGINFNWNLLWIWAIIDWKFDGTKDQT